MGYSQSNQLWERKEEYCQLKNKIKKVLEFGNKGHIIIRKYLSIHLINYLSAIFLISFLYNHLPSKNNTNSIMNRPRTKKAKALQTPLFIEKLIQILDDSSISHIISWTNTNDSFQIKSITQFTETILPRFFKHNNFSSFIRQLNMYGFRKIRHQDGDNVYLNESFKKGNRALLKNIKRKVNLEKEDRIAIYSKQLQPNNTLSRQIQEMKNKQKDLQQICKHLLLQNHKLIEENNTLIRKFKEDEKRKQKKIEQLLISMIAANQHKQPSLMNSQNSHTALMHKSGDNANISDMLSIMTGDTNSDFDLSSSRPDQNPLDILTNALSPNNMKHIKQMFENYYHSNNKQFNLQQNNNNLNSKYLQKQQQIKNKTFTQNKELNHQFDAIKSQKNHLYNQSLQDQDLNGFYFDNSYSQNQENQNQIDTSLKPINEDDDQFISINDFMNLDEENQVPDRQIQSSQEI